ncbi:hypothetical protein NDU88_003790 [Pleurodeles waltl]|uniref:Uncharacterized protein n=1 Tax=Pleurodeles waltl TaxID=8319 RepID=A0AAV7MTH5_PLEWA|nr:hypothetical protein NDU88_003790 [Pleurodeles waltl]
MQALLSAVQLLSSLDILSASVPPTAPWAPTDTLKNTLAELKRQISPITAACIIGTVATGTTGSGDIPSPGVQSPTPNNVHKDRTSRSARQGRPDRGQGRRRSAGPLCPLVPVSHSPGVLTTALGTCFLYKLTGPCMAKQTGYDRSGASVRTGSPGAQTMGSLKLQVWLEDSVGQPRQSVS